MALLAAALIAAAAVETAAVDSRRQQLAAILTEHWQRHLRQNPLFATLIGDKRYNDRLDDFSEERVLADVESDRRIAERLEEIDVAGFPPDEALNRTLLLRQLRENLESARFREWEMPITQFGGFHIDMPQAVAMLPFETKKNYGDYVARLDAIPRAFDQLAARMRKGMADGLMPPRILLEQVAAQAKELAETKPEKSPFMLPASRFPRSFAAAERRRLRAAMLNAVRERVTPAYARFTEFVAKEYAPAGRAEPGLWALPDGEARYAFAVRRETTTALTPAQIHQLGLQEVARDRAAMLEIGRKLGFTDLKSFDAAIAKDPKAYVKTPQELLGLYRRYIGWMEPKLPQLFGRLPKARIEVIPVEAFLEKSAAGAEYNTGTPDGRRPGHVKVNTGDLPHRNILDVETTAYHEGIPGHHMQLSIAQEIPALPPFRQQSQTNAFVEGWALYSERIVEEVDGAYADPYQAYGHLQADLLRAIRLVVDTGLHAMKWSRQQAVDYFHESSSLPEPEVQSETDRYMAWPGQALGYKIGQLRMLDLRERAQRALGAKFDVRSFHDEILSGGAMPLDVLEQRIDAWIARRSGS